MKSRCTQIGAVAVFLASFVALPVRADNPQTPQLRLVPTPRNVKVGEGSFKPTSIAIVSENAEDAFAVHQIADEIKSDLNIVAQVGSAQQREIPQIILKRDGAGLPDEGKAEGYAVVVRPSDITITAPTSAGIFYGVQTVKQLFRANAKDGAIPACTITDWPSLKYRAWQDDISRGPIPTLNYLKREIRTMAEFKENAFTLYTEHVYKLKNHPDISPPDTITAEEIKELTEYAKQYHIDVWGNYQSFGHQAHMFSLPQYADMGDHGWAFDPAREKSYKFLADVYSEIATAYSSPLFCISCDEVGDFSNEDAVAMVKQLGPGPFYTQHINRVADLLKPYNKTPMMWGDIALHHPEDISKLPKNLIVLPWTYGDSGTYDRWLQPYVSSGYSTIVCPGVNCWNRIWPDTREAVANISDFTRDGVKYHTLGQLNTMWRDDGETLFGYCYYPLLWGAETAWSPVVPETGDKSHDQRNARQAQFDQSFDGVFYGMTGDTIAQANRAIGSLGAELSDYVTWRDPLAAWGQDEGAVNALKLQATVMPIMFRVAKATPSAKFNQDTIGELGMQGTRILLAAGKVTTVEAMTHALSAMVKSPDTSHDVDMSKSEADALVSLAQMVKSQFIANWHLENRDWWLDKNVAKYDALIASIKTLPSQVIISPAKREFIGSAAVELKPLTPGSVRYTLDGNEPTDKSTVYSSPISLSKSTVVKARSFLAAGPGPVISATYTTQSLPAKASIYKMTFYQDHTPGLAFDGSDNTFFWSDGPPKFNSSLTVTLDQPAAFKHVIVHTGHPDGGRDKLQHGKLEVWDDKKWEDVGEFKDGQFEGDLPARAIKAVRVHVMSDQPEWLVIREIVLQ